MIQRHIIFSSFVTIVYYLPHVNTLAHNICMLVLLQIVSSMLLLYDNECNISSYAKWIAMKPISYLGILTIYALYIMIAYPFAVTCVK